MDALAAPAAPLTVFAPTNDAFAAALAALNFTAEELLGNTELLTAVRRRCLSPASYRFGALPARARPALLALHSRCS